MTSPFVAKPPESGWIQYDGSNAATIASTLGLYSFNDGTSDWIYSNFDYLVNWFETIVKLQPNMWVARTNDLAPGAAFIWAADDSGQPLGWKAPW